MTSDTTTNPPVTEDTNTQITVELLDGKVTTTSIDVARHFGKRHDNVIQAIRNLECSEAFRLLNFKETIQVIPGPKGSKREEPAYRMTRDGFTFLCMGFTGKEAARWKEAYIDAFNRMEEQLAQQKDKALADAENNTALAVTMALLNMLDAVRQYPEATPPRPNLYRMLLALLNIESLEEASPKDWERVPDILQGLILGELNGKSQAVPALSYSQVGTDLVYRIVQAAHQTEMHLNAIRARQAAGKPFGDPSALHRLANELAELSRLTRELIAHLAKFAQLGAKSHMH